MAVTRSLRMLAVGIGLAACLLGSLAVSAGPASLSVRPSAFGDGNYRAVFSWNSGTDNGSPVVWVCVSYNGAPPLALDSGEWAASGPISSRRGRIPSGSTRTAAARRSLIIRP